MFGTGCGVLTVLLRYFGSYPDGVAACWAMGRSVNRWTAKLAITSTTIIQAMAGYREMELIGHYIEVQVSGFGGMITMVVGVDLNGVRSSSPRTPPGWCCCAR